MIRVAKPDQAPRILRERGHWTAEANQQAFEDGERTFQFDRSIYAARSVKNALVKAQHDKCAFCESHISHVAYGDVEHYRPKGGVRQHQSDQLQQPGYFWLAYAWENLFFACQLCNQRFKQNLFPLADPTKRACSHLDDLTVEKPMLIHPGDEEPPTLIGFREEIAFAIDGNLRALTTIEVVRLNRDMLTERRLTHLKKTRTLKQALLALPADSEIAQEIRDQLAEAVLPKAEYSSMVQALLDSVA